MTDCLLSSFQHFIFLARFLRQMRSGQEALVPNCPSGQPQCHNSIINQCVTFWCLICVQTHGFTAELDFLDCVPSHWYLKQYTHSDEVQVLLLIVVVLVLTILDIFFLHCLGDSSERGPQSDSIHGHCKYKVSF